MASGTDLSTRRETDAQTNGLPPTTAIGDVLAIHAVGGWLSPPLTRFWSTETAVAGRTTTVVMGPGAPEKGGAFELLYEALDMDLTDCVLVIAGVEEVEAAVWGQILSRAARRSGAVAAVVSGGVRDRSALAREGLPVWGLTEHTVGATGLAHVVAINQPLSVAGVPVRPDDVAVVDDGGVVLLPGESAATLLREAGDYAAAEDRVLLDLERGTPLVEAYQQKRTVRARLHAAVDRGRGSP